MKIILIEDEPLVADRLERLIRAVFPGKLNIQKIETLGEAQETLKKAKPDLVFLDLNLDSEDGFELLRQTLIGPYQTIVASANTERAIEAFEFGVLDFIPKPFGEERIKLAWQRFSGLKRREHPGLKSLPVSLGFRVKLLNLNDIIYFKAAGNFTDIHLKDGNTYSQEKALNALELLLPEHFFRGHKSYIINTLEIDGFSSHRGSKYSTTLKNGETLPISRLKVRELRNLLNA